MTKRRQNEKMQQMNNNDLHQNLGACLEKVHACERLEYQKV